MTFKWNSKTYIQLFSWHLNTDFTLFGWEHELKQFMGIFYVIYTKKLIK